jgi:hypothetical protein
MTTAISQKRTKGTKCLFFVALVALCLSGCTGKQNPGDYGDPGKNPPSWSRVGARSGDAQDVRSFTVSWEVLRASETNGVAQVTTLYQSDAIAGQWATVTTFAVPPAGERPQFQAVVMTTNQPQAFWKADTR